MLKTGFVLPKFYDIYPMFGKLRQDLVNTARADSDIVLLPLHADLTEKEVSYIIKSVKEVYA